MKSYRIAVIPGDGIGPEVIREALRVLDAAQDGFRLEIVAYPFGAEHYLRTGEILPDSALREIATMDAILLGAIGDPRVEPGLLEFGIVGRLRFDLDLYVNLRPIRLYAEWLCPLKGKKPEDVDILVVRENTEDAYRGRTLREGDRVVQEMVYTRAGTERVIRYAFACARARRKKLTLVDKANAVRAHALYREVFEEVGREYPDVARDAAYVDAFCMWLVRRPEAFDTVVTTNMFGDIATDLGAALQGGLGIAAGGNIHPGRVSMFEPIHGSAPKYRGQNRACPLAAILAGAMMLEHLGETAAAARIERAVRTLLVERRIPSVAASDGLPTDRVGSLVLSAL
jgi:3-isopropylmalate dehydrogenase